MYKHTTINKKLITILIFLLPILTNFIYIFFIQNISEKYFTWIFPKTVTTSIYYKYPNIPNESSVWLTPGIIGEETSNKFTSSTLKYSDLALNLIPENILGKLETVSEQYEINFSANGCKYFAFGPSNELQVKLLKENNSDLPEPTVNSFGINIFEIKLGPDNDMIAEFLKTKCVLPRNSKFYISDKFYE